MVLGACGEKWIEDKVTELKKRLDNEVDEDVYALIDKEYFFLMQVSCIYVKMNKKWQVLSLLQWSFYLSVLAYHYNLLVGSTVRMMDINMVLFCQNTHFTLLVQLTMIILVWLQNKHKAMTLFHKLLSRDFFDYEEPPAAGADDLRASMVRERRRLSVIPVGVALAAGAVLIIAPIVDKQAGRFDFVAMSQDFSTHLPYPYGRYPFQTREGLNFYLALGGQVIIGLLLTLVIGAGGFLFLNLSQNISLQLQLLQNSMVQIETRAEGMYFRQLGIKIRTSYDDHYFRYCYSECLKKNFMHHQVILRAFHYMEEIVSVPVFLAYLTGTIVIALSLVSAGSADELPGTTVASMVLCGVEIAYMFLFSVFGQRLGDLNMELRYKIYDIKWYLCNKQVKSNLMIFQEKTLKPMTMMAAGIVPANMETFATVMNSSYSYYNLVNAFGK